MNNLRYADDTTILTDDKEGMRKLPKKLKEESEEAGLMLNLKKTKIMITGTPKGIHSRRNRDGDKHLHFLMLYNYQRWLRALRN
jgi:SepF-like predicted cell division protein (DUF552 family)